MARTLKQMAVQRVWCHFNAVKLNRISLIFLLILGSIIKYGVSSKINNDNITKSELLQLKFGDRLLPRYKNTNISIISQNKFQNLKTVFNKKVNNITIINDDYNRGLSGFKDNTNNFDVNYDLLVNPSYPYSLLKIHQSKNNNLQVNSNQNNSNHRLLSYYEQDNLQQPLKKGLNVQIIDLAKQNEVRTYTARLRENSNSHIPIETIPAVASKLVIEKIRRNDNYLDNIDRSINMEKADHLIKMSTEYFVVPTLHPISKNNLSVSSISRSQKKSSSVENKLINNHELLKPHPRFLLNSKTSALLPNILSATVTPTNNRSIMNTIVLRKEPWVAPILVISSMLMIQMVAFEVFVLYQAWKTSPPRRFLFLGQMLLCGLFSCSILAAIITVTPTVFSCGTLRFGIGIAYALVFGTLLVKCVSLISLNGGNYLPTPYQGLLLMFAIFIQLAINIQWLITQPAEIQHLLFTNGTQLLSNNSNNRSISHLKKISLFETSINTADHLHGTVISLCKTKFPDLLFSLAYIYMLIVFVAILAIKSRRIRDNYREANFIALAIGGTIAIWFGWNICGLVVADRNKDGCTAFGLIATSAAIFLVMFMTREKQLLTMGQEELYVKDSEDHFSSVSCAASRYSPSFFHFRPIKYGVMGSISDNKFNRSVERVSQIEISRNLEHYKITDSKDETHLYASLKPTLSTNPNVFFQQNGVVHPGMMY